ncbi:MAG: hypothetical protein ACRBCK_08280 [Alphaproteobacteria bacterium]
MSKFDENDIVIVADLKGTPVYLGDGFSEASLNPDKAVQVRKEDDLRYVFVSHADLNLLSQLRERRDEILQDPLITGVETIKILSEPEIEAAEALHISVKGDIKFFAEREEITMERPMFGPGSYDV